MAKTASPKADKLFSASARKDQQVLKDKAKAEQARLDRMAQLRELRLAKEAADAEVAAEKAEEKAAAEAARKAAAPAKKKPRKRASTPAAAESE